MQGVKPTDVYQKQSGPFSYKYPQLLDNERTFFCFIKLNHWRGRKSSWASGTQALPGLDSLFLYLYFSLSVSLIFSDQTPPCQKHGGLQFLESLFLHPRKGTKFVPSELRLKNPRKDFRLVQLRLLTTLRPITVAREATSSLKGEVEKNGFQKTQDTNPKRREKGGRANFTEDAQICITVHYSWMPL